jgi:hypothetical protein
MGASRAATPLGSTSPGSALTPTAQADLADMILSGQASPASSYKSASPFAVAAAAAAGSSPLAGLPHRPKPGAPPGVPAVQQYGFGAAATSGGGAAPGASSSAARQGSAPLAIPGRSCSRVRSLHDLKPVADMEAAEQAGGGGGGSEHLSAAELQQQRLRLAPSSAPAATRGLLGQMLSSTKASLAASDAAAQARDTSATYPAAPGGPAAAQAGQLQRQASAVSTPHQHQQQQQQLVRYSSLRPEAPANPFTAYSTSLGAAFSLGGSSGGGGGGGGGGVGGGFPGSSSPQLMFAMTPSAGPSIASLMADTAPAACPGGQQQQLLPVPVLSGRDISAMATIKRPSWSSR